jgi:rhodanese-related sulfurtransferase
MARPHVAAAPWILPLLLGSGVAWSSAPAPDGGASRPAAAEAISKSDGGVLRSLSPAAFREELSRLGAAGGVVLVDVREPEEFAAGHLEGARLMPWNSGGFTRDHRTLGKDRPLFIYCARGVRSKKAAQLLLDEGWPQVTVLEGGYEDYRAAFPAR